MVIVDVNIVFYFDYFVLFELSKYDNYFLEF